ncbi:hypothetical protein PRVXT_000724 [Proteinivorax tanatarense]|uniref:Lipoprotein n=1 Tax=Proteinivorax tanatarense TaxID=1260629 RepID=A0AAU7VNG1_9FIRM
MVVILTFLMLLTGCIPGDGSYTEEQPAGFFWGIWHGWVAPISLIIGIFNEGIRIYEPINTGSAYDFGFYLAVVGGFGGISFARKNK